MWKVYETKAVTKGLVKVPVQVQRKYKAWIEIIKRGGSNSLKSYPGFRDEKLKGEFRECRSSRLNIQYRVVYREERKVREVYVLKVTPHKYEEV
ncbi:MAG: type II toxin-antitoxin system mRNA interferase toxin, RelE/StbE family [Peredibacter sp.]|nr:type II toxin-antitoxin system mRNA interferase toxin, RelE/StbE family [Peredibacter sp.]